ncbi:ImmA/IrrE family metallo-endopeptidase [Arthrobacter sp. UYCu723]
MSRITVSAARFRSMLANRNWTADGVAASVTTEVDLRVLASQDQEVGFQDLQTIAKHFKRPWSYLLCDDEEQFRDLGQDNRTFANQRLRVTADLMTEFEAASLMLEAAAELFPDEAYEVPPNRISRDLAPMRAAAEIRAFLEVSHDEQLTTKDEFSALRLWVDALHRRGVYVSQRRLRDTTIRAFSKVHGGHALLVVDTGDTAYARIFSAVHEYCHIVLRTAGICDLDEFSDVERYCNDVAAAVLLPDNLLAKELHARTLMASSESEDEQLIALSHRLRVSQAALLIRLRDRGTISQDRYDEIENRRRARRPGKKRSGGKFYTSAINRVGRRFAHNVFGALSDGTLDRQDAGALLGVGEHLVDRYRVELFQGDSGSK